MKYPEKLQQIKKIEDLAENTGPSLFYIIHRTHCKNRGYGILDNAAYIKVVKTS